MPEDKRMKTDDLKRKSGKAVYDWTETKRKLFSHEVLSAGEAEWKNLRVSEKGDQGA